MAECIHLQHGVDLHDQTFHVQGVDVRDLGGTGVDHTTLTGAVIHFPLVHREPRSIQLREELDLGIDLLTGDLEILSRINTSALRTTVQDSFRHASAAQEWVCDSGYT